jgi:hypothetical protein
LEQILDDYEYFADGMADTENLIADAENSTHSTRNIWSRIFNDGMEFIKKKADSVNLLNEDGSTYALQKHYINAFE